MNMTFGCKNGRNMAVVGQNTGKKPKLNIIMITFFETGFDKS